MMNKLFLLLNVSCFACFLIFLICIPLRKSLEREDITVMQYYISYLDICFISLRKNIKEIMDLQI